MNKKIVNWTIVVFFSAIVILIVIQQTGKTSKVPHYLLGKLEMGHIAIERKISGKILPAEEIAVKSRINGIVNEIYVEVGQHVSKGQDIAMVRNMTEPMEAENLSSVLRQSRIQYEATLQQYIREKKLLQRGLTSLSDFEILEARLFREKEQHASAERRLLLSTEGLSNDDESLSNIIVAPAEGIVLSLPIKTGSPVINQNIYSEGTTLATIANMDNLNFTGEIAEIDLLYFHAGMPLFIETQILKTHSLNAILSKIHPKGRDEQGVIKFFIEATVNSDRKIEWAGINATATAIVEQRNNVMYVEEKFLHYENNVSYIWIKDGNGDFVRTICQTGISDGIQTEIISGLKIDDTIKIPDL